MYTVLITFIIYNESAITKMNIVVFRLLSVELDTRQLDFDKIIINFALRFLLIVNQMPKWAYLYVKLKT